MEAREEKPVDDSVRWFVDSKGQRQDYFKVMHACWDHWRSCPQEIARVRNPRAPGCSHQEILLAAAEAGTHYWSHKEGFKDLRMARVLALAARDMACIAESEKRKRLSDERKRKEFGNALEMRLSRYDAEQIALEVGGWMIRGIGPSCDVFAFLSALGKRKRIKAQAVANKIALGGDHELHNRC
jgi:hypothetical protein